MIDKKQYSIEIGGKTLTLEMSSLAEQANAAVLAKYGETVVLVTVVMAPAESSADYLPLKVDYEERFYAAGKIIGSRFIRREGRPSDEAILSGRLVDRVIRPLFDQRIRRDIQVVTTVLAYDEENDPDFPGLMAASTALGISNIPWNGPVGGLRITNIKGEFAANPNRSALENSEVPYEAFVAGPRGRINMLELSGREAAEEKILQGFELAQKEIDRLVEFQGKIIGEIGRPKAEVHLYEPAPELRQAAQEFLLASPEPASFADPRSAEGFGEARVATEAESAKRGASRLEEAMYAPSKMEQASRLLSLKNELFAHLAEKIEKADLKAAELVMENIVDKMVHKNILEKDRRPDGRGLTDIRALFGEVGLFSRTHGSAIFVRGNTQALAVTTLAAPGSEQLVETMETTGKRRFMLHYNFPPYSVGEIGNFRGPGRREIGHGALAEKALKPLIPPVEEFPYTIRVVSEILSSNGSSSMATVCAGAMSLMDAGVPLKKPAAGIAMGLMLDDQDNYKVLTDLQGPEDHYGDMDFKVAGTEDGVNAIQLDVKFHGLTMPMIAATLTQAREARLQILKVMQGVIAKPRPQLSPYVPSIIQLKISTDKIGLVIGPGGKMINGLIKTYGLTTIDIEDD
ncbi:MAG: KH domain-containing protein, partial [Patescibacteria group bacterium]